MISPLRTSPIRRGFCCQLFRPYMPVTGSLNSGIWGVLNVKIIKESPSTTMREIAALEHLHPIFSLLNSFVSRINEIAAEMKNIEMLNQSGDFPNAPLYV